MTSTNVQRLLDRGAKRMDPAKKAAYLQAVDEKVIPAIKKANERQRVAVHNARITPLVPSVRRSAS